MNATTSEAICYSVTATDPKPVKGPKSRPLPRKSIMYFIDDLDAAHESILAYQRRGYRTVEIASFPLRLNLKPQTGDER